MTCSFHYLQNYSLSSFFLDLARRTRDKSSTPAQNMKDVHTSYWWTDKTVLISFGLALGIIGVILNFFVVKVLEKFWEKFGWQSEEGRRVLEKELRSKRREEREVRREEREVRSEDRSVIISQRLDDCLNRLEENQRELKRIVENQKELIYYQHRLDKTYRRSNTQSPLVKLF